MGLIHNLLISVIHLAFVAMNILVLMVLVKVVYDRWRIGWLKQAADTVKPLISSVLDCFRMLILRITGKTYSEKTSLILLLICLSVTRFIIATFL